MNRVTQYALDVTEEREKTGRYVKLACKRHLSCLEKAKQDNFKYTFDEDKANLAISFFECLKFTDGEIAGQDVELFPFQAFIIGSLFGWVDKETGCRRYRKSYIQLARKNAKSLLNSGIAILLAAFDKYDNAQVYCVATKMKQAKIVWEQASKFIQKESDLREFFKIKNHDSTIECLKNGGKIIALGRDTSTIDGFDPHGGIVDEYHSHTTNQMVKLLEDGSVNQSQSLISIITTAGFNLNSPCYAEWEYCKNVLEEVIDNDNYFIYIAQMDAEDDIWDADNWIKANPLVCNIAKGKENLLRFAEEAKAKGGLDLTNFLTKSLNVWVEYADNQYIAPSELKECASNKTLADFKGKKCYAGLDLSTGGDLTSLALVFPYRGAGQKKYFIHSHSFIPSKRVQEHIKTDKAPYQEWIKQGLLTATETCSGIKTDYKYIISYLRELIEEYDLDLQQIGYDKYNADAFLQDLEDFGVDLIEVYQSPKWLSAPTEDFKLEVQAKNIEFNKDNALLKWSIVNAKLTSNSNGEVKIDKDKTKYRIDPIDAVIDAYKLAFKEEDLKIDINKIITEENFKKLGW